MGRESREVWEKRVERWRDSGLSVKEFAREVGINAHTLAGWRWRLRVKERSSAAHEAIGAPRVRGEATPEAAKPIEFVELMRAPTTEARFEVVAASGWTVRVPAKFDAESLRQLLAVLERA